MVLLIYPKAVYKTRLQKWPTSSHLIHVNASIAADLLGDLNIVSFAKHQVIDLRVSFAEEIGV